MAIDLDFFENEKNIGTEKRIFINPYKELLEIHEKLEAIATIIPENFLLEHSFQSKDK